MVTLIGEISSRDALQFLFHLVLYKRNALAASSRHGKDRWKFDTKRLDQMKRHKESQETPSFPDDGTNKMPEDLRNEKLTEGLDGRPF